MSRPKIAADAGPIRSEPIRRVFQFGSNVFDAIRRYRFMVLAVAILGYGSSRRVLADAAKVYRAKAFITMPSKFPFRAPAGERGPISRQPGAAPAISERRPASCQHR